jgi:hypothetical protein
MDADPNHPKLPEPGPALAAEGALAVTAKTERFNLNTDLPVVEKMPLQNGYEQKEVDCRVKIVQDNFLR